jgi:hypothetical protein
VTAHGEKTLVVAENDAVMSLRRNGREKHGTEHIPMAPRLPHEETAKAVPFLGDFLKPIKHGGPLQTRQAAHDDPRRLASRVGINDMDDTIKRRHTKFLLYRKRLLLFFSLKTSKGTKKSEGHR